MYQPSQTITIKNRNTFSLIAQYSDDTGVPLSLDGMQIDVQIRKKFGQLVAPMLISIKDNGLFEMRLPNNFVLPIESLYLDVRFMQSGMVVNSDILQLNVVEVVTHG